MVCGPVEAKRNISIPFERDIRKYIEVEIINNVIKMASSR